MTEEPEKEQPPAKKAAKKAAKPASKGKGRCGCKR